MPGRQSGGERMTPPRHSNGHAGNNGNGHGMNGNGRVKRGDAEEKQEITVPGLYKRTSSGGRKEVSNDAFADSALRVLPPELLYRSAGTIGVLVGNPGKREFDPTDTTDFRLFVDRHARLVSWVTRDNHPESIYVNCNDSLAKLIHNHAKRSEIVRDLVRIVQYPVYGPGFVRYEPGWSSDGTFFDCPSSLASVEPEMHQSTIMEILEDLVIDFPFKDEASRQNFFGQLLTPIIRPALNGNIPLHLVLASLERTGKSKLVEEIWGGIILGRPTPAQQMTGNDEEFDKRILGMLIAGETLIHLDNLGEFLNSPVLASLLTSTTYQGRVLGQSVMRRVLNTLIVAASGNNVRATGEIVKRTIPIRLQPKSDHPENRQDFVHGDIREYVASVRPAVLSALLGMVERWKQAGCPAGTKPMGGFEQWARVIGGIMSVNGFDQWLTNVEEWRIVSDPETEELRAFVFEWARENRDASLSSSELIRLCQRFDLFGTVLKKPSAAAALSAFSRTVLARNLDRPIHGLQIVQVRQSGNTTAYKLSGDADVFDMIQKLPGRTPSTSASGQDGDGLPYFGN